MNDRQLQDLLRRIPRDDAREDFRKRVLERLDEPAPAPAVPVWARASLAAAAALVMIVLAPWGISFWNDSRGPSPHDRERDRTALAALRAERDSLERELREIAALASPADDGVIYLGGNDEVDLVFDLRSAARLMGGGGAHVEPASFSEGQGRP